MTLPLGQSRQVAHVFRATIICCLFAAIASCATAPRAVVTLPDGVISGVERNLDHGALFTAVAREVARVPVCFSVPPAHWLSETPFTVQFGPTHMLGHPDIAIAPDAEQQLDLFVSFGLWTKAALPDVGPSVYQYTLTEMGWSVYNGHPFQARPNAQFCPPAERRLMRITGVERQRHGVLLVRFEYAANDNPSWLREEVRPLLSRPLPSVGPTGRGVVRLYRVWRRGVHPEEGAPLNGSLEPSCWDDWPHPREFCGAYLN